MNKKIKKSKKNLISRNKVKSRVHKKNKSLSKVQKGKGLFNGFFEPVNNLKETFRKAKTSETKLINAYEKLTESVDSYYKLYNSHLENLVQLDTFLNSTNFETLFKGIIIKEHFKKQDKIDRSLPLLLRNFNVGDDTSGTALRRESLIKQIRYKLYNTFPEREQALIKDIEVKISKDGELAMIITTIENKPYRRELKHNNFIINMAYLNRELKDIMRVVKENLKYESNIHKVNNNEYSMINSNNIYPSSRGSGKSIKKKSTSKNVNFNQNEMVQFHYGANSNKKSKNSGNNFNLFNLARSSTNKNRANGKPKFQSRRMNKREIKFDLGQNLIGPEGQALGKQAGLNQTFNTSPQVQIKPQPQPQPQPIEGFLPPNMQGLQFKGPIPVEQQVSDCESIGNDTQRCRANPSCRFDFVSAKCVNT